MRRYQKPANLELSNLLLSLSTQDFKWLARSVWDPAAVHGFAVASQKLFANIYRAPPFQSRRKAQRAAAVDCWVLQFTEEETPALWLEAQLFPGGFPAIFLVIVSTRTEHSPLLPKALAHFVSAVFAAAEIETIHAVSEVAAVRQALASISTQQKNVFSFNSEALLLGSAEQVGEEK